MIEIENQVFEEKKNQDFIFSQNRTALLPSYLTFLRFPTIPYFPRMPHNNRLPNNPQPHPAYQP